MAAIVTILALTGVQVRRHFSFASKQALCAPGSPSCSVFGKQCSMVAPEGAPSSADAASQHQDSGYSPSASMRRTYVPHMHPVVVCSAMTG